MLHVTLTNFWGFFEVFESWSSVNIEADVE